MAQNRYRHGITDSSGEAVSGVMELEPPPSLLKLVHEHPSADAEWKKWLNLQYEYLGTLNQLIQDSITTATRVTTDTTLDAEKVVFCDTDSTAITITLPAGTDGKTYRIINTGSSGNNVTITPDGTELLNGVNASETLIDAENLLLTFETTEGWW